MSVEEEYEYVPAFWFRIESDGADLSFGRECEGNIWTKMKVQGVRTRQECESRRAICSCVSVYDRI